MAGLFDLDIGGLGKSIMDGLDELVTSDDERAAAKLKVQELMAAPMLMQAEANIQSAKSTSAFVAGGRPSLIWVCSIALFYHWMIKDFLIIGLVTFSSHAEEIIPMLPTIDGHAITGLVTALLGLGALRTFEKTKGVAR